MNFLFDFRLPLSEYTVCETVTRHSLAYNSILSGLIDELNDGLHKLIKILLITLH